MNASQRTSGYRRLLRLAMFCAVAAVLLSAAGTASACPSCKVALASQGKGDLVSGFFYSILFMLSMPFAILGSFSGYMYLLVRRARREQQAQGVVPQPASHVARPTPANRLAEAEEVGELTAAR